MGCIIKRILTLKEPIQSGPINVWDETGMDITKSCMYSWSSDSVCWTNWTDYNTYIKISKNIESDYYLRVLLFGGFSKIAINDGITTCYSICLSNENMFLQDLCSESVFDPYANLDCALQLQQQLSDSVICMLGIPCYYFRVIPDPKSADYTFKEYVLHNVESVKYLKLMVQDGTMPSSKPQMTEFDFDWEVDWEVELSKNYFAKAFGDTAFPKHNDFVYIPMMKRMWNVNSAYDEKNEGLLWHSTTWKLALVKYNEHTEIEQGDFEDVIDNLLINTYENTFEHKEANEQRIETSTDQITSPTYSADNLNQIFMTDYLRSNVSDDEIRNVVAEQVNNGSNVIARNCYSFANNDSYITYQKKFCGENGTLIMLLEKQLTNATKTLFKSGNIEVKLSNNSVCFGTLACELEDSTKYIVVAKWNRQNYTTSLEIYKQIKPEGIPIYMIRPELYKFDFENPVYNNTDMYNDDYNMSAPQQISLSPYPFKVFYCKLFNAYLDSKSTLREAVKYTTSTESCVVNDIARPFEEAYGFSVK